MGKRKPSAKLEENEELRGFVVKAYPTQEQTKTLYAMQCECRMIWNYLVEQHNAHISRCIERAVQDGALLPLPERPQKDAPARDRRAWNLAWERAQFVAAQHCRKLEGYEWPRLTPVGTPIYAPLRERCATELGRELVSKVANTMAVVTRFAAARVPKRGGNWRPPRFKRAQPPWLETTMVQARFGVRFSEGTFGPRGWHDCQLRMPGIVLDCRAGRPFPEGRLVDGASLVRKADGWYASVRFARSPRLLPRPTRGIVAVCLGLIDLATTSDGDRWANPRGNEYTKLCAWMAEESARLAAEGDANAAHDMQMRKNRYQLRMSRHSREVVLSRILPHLSQYATIVLGTLRREDVQGPQCRLGDDDDGGATSACGILRAQILERFSDRCVQVDAPGVDDSDPGGTARKLISKHAELNAA